MLRVLDMTAETRSNWKIITDNFNEAYHVKVLHPELIPYVAADYADCQFDCFPHGHNRGWFPSFMPSVQYGSDVIGEPLKSMAAAWDVNSDDYVGRDTWQQLRVDIQAAKRERGEAQGYVHYSYRADYQLTDYVIYNLFPNNVITVGPDGVQLLRPRPHPTDPCAVSLRPLVVGESCRRTGDDARHQQVGQICRWLTHPTSTFSMVKKRWAPRPTKT
jgi:phenylpropionate dioxygenase-like ring-hydroxylating dioxygenase large terminal subunit